MFTPERIATLNAERLATVLPDLRVMCERLIKIAALEGYQLIVTCGYRSNAAQTKLYAQGRTTAGKVVTNAKAGQSKHNHKKAVDFAFVDDEGNISWDVKLYLKLGAWTKQVGLKWGGDWKRFKDYPHVEL